MTIKHIVLAGGGPMGFRFLGAAQKLEQENFWEMKDIESIYATSAGAMMSVCLCLKYDWDTLVTYVIERPWQDTLK